MNFNQTFSWTMRDRSTDRHGHAWHRRVKYVTWPRFVRSATAFTCVLAKVIWVFLLYDLSFFDHILNWRVEIFTNVLPRLGHCMLGRNVPDIWTVSWIQRHSFRVGILLEMFTKRQSLDLVLGCVQHCTACTRASTLQTVDFFHDPFAQEYIFQ